MKLILPLVVATTVLASDVVKLTASSFDSTIAKNPLVLAEFFAPWCGHCKSLAPEYEEAATTLKSEKGIVIAKIDCTEEVDLCQQHDVQGYPTLKLFRGPSNVAPYAGARKADAIISYMKKQSLPAVSEVTHANLDSFSRSDKVVVIAFFDKDDKKSNKTFASIADSLREDYVFGASNDASLVKTVGTTLPGLVVYKSFDEGKEIYSGKFKEEGIVEFIKTSAIPLLGEIGPDTYATYMQSGIPLAYLFVESDADITGLSAIVTKLARQYKGKINFATIDATAYGSHADNLNLKQEWPAIAIQDTVKGSKFPMPQDKPITQKSLSKFLADFVASKIEPSVKSEPIPESQDNAVTVVVRHQYDEIVMDDNKDVLLEFYAPWCGHCKSLAPKFEELGEMYSDLSDKVTIAKIDATLNDVPEEIKGFPTIKLYPAGNKKNPIEYNGDRSIESFVEFIKLHGTHKVDPEGDIDMYDETQQTLGQAAKAATKAAAGVADSGSSAADKATKVAGDAAKSVTKAAGDAAESASKVVGDAADSAKSATKVAGESAKSVTKAAGDAAASATKAAAKAAKAASKSASSVTEAVADKATSVASVATEAAADAASSGASVASAASAAAEAGANSVKSAGKAVTSKIGQAGSAASEATKVVGNAASSAASAASGVSGKGASIAGVAKDAIKSAISAAASVVNDADDEQDFKDEL